MPPFPQPSVVRIPGPHRHALDWGVASAAPSRNVLRAVVSELAAAVDAGDAS